jgi:ABC-type multidrug transport system fused ATPase/permease subunit
LSLNAYLSFRHTGIIIIGTLFALYTYLQNIGGVFSNFAYQYGKIVEQDTALRAAEIINEAYEKINHEEYPSLPADWHTLEIRNLSFSYHQEKKEGEPESKKHLDEVDLTIVRNQKIAFIGESGSGKSTALALLRGLYKPNIVEMWCDGNLLSGGMGALYHQVTLIPQEPELFNSTVEDNITMDIPTHSNNIQRVMDIAQFQSVLTRLPDGLNTNVMEKGVSLSGGEKQRLALARGLLAGWNSDFVFLDEPTSSVDFTNEMKIYENILLAFKDTTVISTVHNLALLKYFDSIYLFGNGKVIARGNFDELKSHPSFNILWENYNKSLK